MGGTFAAKSLGFVIGKLAVHGSDYAKLAKSWTFATAAKAVLQMGGHYLTLQYSEIPYYLSHFVGYAIPGIGATLLRYTLDYKSNLITFGGKNPNA